MSTIKQLIIFSSIFWLLIWLLVIIWQNSAAKAIVWPIRSQKTNGKVMFVFFCRHSYCWYNSIILEIIEFFAYCLYSFIRIFLNWYLMCKWTILISLHVILKHLFAFYKYSIIYLLLKFRIRVIIYFLIFILFK